MIRRKSETLLSKNFHSFVWDARYDRNVFIFQQFDGCDRADINSTPRVIKIARAQITREFKSASRMLALDRSSELHVYADRINYVMQRELRSRARGSRRFSPVAAAPRLRANFLIYFCLPRGRRRDLHHFL